MYAGIAEPSRGAFVGAEQIATSSNNYRKIDESENDLVELKEPKNQKNNQQDNNLLEKSPSILNIVSLFFSVISLIISVYLFLKIRSYGK